ncbi:unnamed protein product [Bemisia tabaci]|uniref:Uncharacterized protein n=1 Tax=Bemisia tabaci TaxID=7038 RepID=A0A9P0F5G0_BEMTA|nr:unnamed protein product [Bemisia tabaci]
MVRAATVSDAHVHLHYSARKFRNNLIAGISRAEDVATQDRQVTVRSGAAENGVRSNGSSAISHHTSDGISSGASICNRRQSIDSLAQHSTVNGKSSPKSKRKVANVSNTLDGDSIPVKLVCETSSKSSAENSNKKVKYLSSFLKFYNFI